MNAEFELVADCGHFSMLDKPEVVNASIERLHERQRLNSRQLESATTSNNLLPW